MRKRLICLAAMSAALTTCITITYLTGHGKLIPELSVSQTGHLLWGIFVAAVMNELMYLAVFNRLSNGWTEQLRWFATTFIFAAIYVQVKAVNPRWLNDPLLHLMHSLAESRGVITVLALYVLVVRACYDVMRHYVIKDSRTCAWIDWFNERAENKRTRDEY